MKRAITYFLMFLAISLGLSFQAQASRPVAVTLEGCVINGALFSTRTTFEGGKPASVSGVYGLQVKDLDLAPYEGKKLRLRGWLAPGDRFTPNPKSLKVLGPCDRKSKAAISKKNP